jgi:hypothetical protein
MTSVFRVKGPDPGVPKKVGLSTFPNTLIKEMSNGEWQRKEI